MKEIKRYKNRYVVETASREIVPRLGRETEARPGEWEFEKAFELLSDAEAYAKRIAEDYEWVRIIETEGAYS